jgi:aminopeptidase N
MADEETGTKSLMIQQEGSEPARSAVSPSRATKGQYGSVPTAADDSFVRMEEPLTIRGTGLSRKTLLTGAGLAAAATIAVAVSLAVVLTGSDPIEESDGCGYTSYRLKDSAMPTAYTVYWNPLFVAPHTFTGRTTIQLAMTMGNQRCIQLHAKDLVFDSVEAAISSDSNIPSSVDWWWNSEATNERIVVQLPRVVAVGENVTLSFSFHADLGLDMVGLYLSTYEDDAGQTISTVCTQFEATFARRAFPCFDEPAYKAKFDLTLDGIPTGYTALSNMPIAAAPVYNTTTMLWTYTYQPSPKMSTYLVAAVAAPLINVTGTAGANNVQVSVFAVARGQNAQLISFALDAGMSVLDYYESVFNVPYPLYVRPCSRPCVDAYMCLYFMLLLFAGPNWIW